MLAAAQTDQLLVLAKNLGVSPQHLFKIINSAEKLYTEIELSKRTAGSFRKIFIPSLELKGVQRLIHKKLLREMKVHDSAYGYKSGISVVDAAKKLCGKKAVLKVDIADFFPSISAKRVNGLFKSEGFDSKTAWMLTRLTTYKGSLCQGSPTSPVISNLISRNLDRQLYALSHKWQCGYIRYSDDIFLYKGDNFNSHSLLSTVEKIVSHNGFSLNSAKTKYFHREQNKIILGLNVSGLRPEMTKHQRRITRSAFHRAVTDFEWAKENFEALSGMLQWYKCIYGKNDIYESYNVTLASIYSIRRHRVYYSR